MYTNTGYLDISDAELEDNTIPLRINCCGVYRLLTRVSMTTIRATGPITSFSISPQAKPNLS